MTLQYNVYPFKEYLNNEWLFLITEIQIVQSLNLEKNLKNETKAAVLCYIAYDLFLTYTRKYYKPLMPSSYFLSGMMLLNMAVVLNSAS